MTTPISLTWTIFLLLCQIMACLLNRLSTEYQVKGLVPLSIVDYILVFLNSKTNSPINHHDGSQHVESFLCKQFSILIPGPLISSKWPLGKIFGCWCDLSEEIGTWGGNPNNETKEGPIGLREIRYSSSKETATCS